MKDPRDAQTMQSFNVEMGSSWSIHAHKPRTSWLHSFRRADPLPGYHPSDAPERYYDLRAANAKTANTALARELKGRHLQMIAFGGAIGTGLFVASDLTKSIFVAIFLSAIVIINLFSVRTYGEAEFIFSLIKITAIVGFILLAIVINVGGEPESGYIGGMYWRNPGPFNNGFKGFCSVLVTSAFSFTGTELIGLAAAETANPRKSLPTAIKQVFWRITIFYIVALMLVGLLVPSDDKRLVGGDNVADATASPFVIAIEKAGTSLLPSIMNAIILVAVISVGNSAVFGSSRTLAALAEQSHAPQIFAYVDRQGRPLMAILFASCIGLLAFLADVSFHDSIFNWLLSISALSTLFTWGSICLCYIRFRKAWYYNAHTLEQLPFKSHVGVTGAWFAFVGYILVLASQIWIAVSPVNEPGIDRSASGLAQNFFLKVLAIPIILLFYLSHKIWYRTQIVRLPDMDVVTGRRYFRVHVMAEQEREERHGWPRWKKVYRFLC
ncbi:amino acid transporter AAT family [Fusarium sp. NRRL 25303]|nr:amino acid transporter AAT family [Fusarium sp. NRRL 25303]